MVGHLQKQEILPASPAVPSFVCVDVVVRSTTFLSDLYAQLMDQFVVHVVERIIREKSVVHQSLTKSNKRQVVVVKGIARHLKENRAQRSIFIALKPMMNLKTALKHHFQTSCIFIPYQSTRSQKMTPKLS